MSWVWLGTGGVYVDIFLPDDSLATAGLRTGWIEVPGSTPPWRFRVPRPDPSGRVGSELEDLPMVRPDSVPESGGEGSVDVTRADVRAAISKAEPVVEPAMNRSFGHGEDTLGEFSGVPVRGRWVRGDVAGQARHQVLLGVLGERIPVDHRAASPTALSRGRPARCVPRSRLAHRRAPGRPAAAELGPEQSRTAGLGSPRPAAGPGLPRTFGLAFFQ